jgi:hypothetical protein
VEINKGKKASLGGNFDGWIIELNRWFYPYSIFSANINREKLKSKKNI